MALYLDEDMVGSDANMIAFPHLLLCMGLVVLLDDGTLVGAHFTRRTTEQPLLSMMRREVLASGSAMSELYCAANLAIHCGEHGGLDINGKAEALGFTGPGFVFDFGYLKPKDGAYFQIISTGGGQNARCRFRLNENMNYQGGRGLPVYKVSLPHGGGHKVRRSGAFTVGATVKDGNDLLAPFMKPVTIS